MGAEAAAFDCVPDGDSSFRGASGTAVTLLREIFAVMVGEAFPAGEDAAGGTGETADSVRGVSLIVGAEGVLLPGWGPPLLAEGRNLIAGFAPCNPD